MRPVVFSRKKMTLLPVSTQALATKTKLYFLQKHTYHSKKIHTISVCPASTWRNWEKTCWTHSSVSLHPTHGRPCRLSANKIKGVGNKNDGWIEFKLTQTTMMFVTLNDMMFKNIDSQSRMVKPKPAIPDVFFHKFGLACTQSLKSFTQLWIDK